jgi:ipoprotein LpqH
MKHTFLVGIACAAVCIGCSASRDAVTGQTTAVTADSAEPGSAHGTAQAPPGPAAQMNPGDAHVILNKVELPAAGNVGCHTDAGVTTVTVDTTPKTTVVLSDESTPTVRSVRIGEPGAEAPSVAYVPGLSGAAAKATRDGNSYTVTGTGMGAVAPNPDKPVEMPFEVSATCP